MERSHDEDAEAGGLVPQMVLDLGHREGVLRMAFSPDGRFLASASFDTLLVWDLETCRVRWRWAPEPGRPFGISDFRFSPDGALFVVGGWDEGWVVEWDLEAGSKRVVVEGASGTLAFQGGGLLVSSNWREVVVTRLATGTAVATFPLPEEIGGRIDTLEFSPDGLVAAIECDTGRERCFRLVDLRVGDTLAERWQPFILWWHESGGDAGPPQCVEKEPIYSEQFAFSADGRHLGICSEGDVLVVDVQSRERTAELSGDGNLQGLAWSPVEPVLAVCRTDWLSEEKLEVVFYRAPDGRRGECWELEAPIPSRLGAAMAFTPDGKLLAVVEGAGISVVEVSSGEAHAHLSGLEARPCRLAFSPDGHRLAVSYGDGRVWLWDPRTGELAGRLKRPEGPGSAGRDRVEAPALSFSPDGTELFTVEVGSGHAWDLRTGEVRETFWPDGSAAPLREEARGCSVAGCARTSDGRLRAELSEDRGEIRIREGAAGEVCFTLPVQKEHGPVTGLCFDPEGERLAVGYYGPLAQVWELGTRTLCAEREVYGDANDCLAFSPDGAVLAVAGSYSAVLGLVNLEEDVYPTELAVGARMRDLAYSPDGRLIAAALETGEVALLDASGTRLASLVLLNPDPEAPEWISHTPGHHYHGSADVERWLRWQVGEALLDGDAYAERFRQPERVVAALSGRPGT